MGVIINQLMALQTFYYYFTLTILRTYLKKKLKVTLGEIKKEESKKA